ncbi:hypothetical protein [Legionella sp. WA2024007413]
MLFSILSIKKVSIMCHRSHEYSVALSADLSASSLFVCDLVVSQSHSSLLVILVLPDFP